MGMTPTEFRAALEALRWTQRGVAAVLRCDERQIRRWATGAYPIPERIASWLATLAAFHRAHPPP